MTIPNRILTLAALIGASIPGWTAPLRWNGPANLDDSGVSVAVDPAGMSVTVGTTDTGGANGKDVLIVARNILGAIVWQRTFDGGIGADEAGRKVVLDPFGNIFVLAAADNPGTGKDILVLKLTLAGNPVARVYFNDPFNRDDTGLDIAYDPNNFVVVVGSWQTPAGDTDVLVTRMPDNLAFVVGQTVPNPAGDDALNGVALDPPGNIYAVGKWRSMASADDVTFQRWSTGLAFGGQTLYNGPGNGNDSAADIVRDTFGLFHVAATSLGAGTGSDIAALRVTAAGNIVNLARYNRAGASNERAAAVSLFKNTAVVVGSSEAASTDLCVLRLTPAYGLAWVANFDGAGGGYDSANSVAFWNNRIVAAGVTTNVSGNLDGFAVCVNQFGVGLWKSIYDFAGGDDANAKVASHPMGIFVAGTSADAAGLFDQYTDRLRPTDGVSLW